MSAEYIEDIVKEEYTIKESDIIPELLTDETSGESKSKCGEVFLDHDRDKFTFLCSMCLQSFLDLLSFGEHIRNVHPIPIYETIRPNLQENDAPLIKFEPSERQTVVDFDQTIPDYDIQLSDSLSEEHEKIIEMEETRDFTDDADCEMDSLDSTRQIRSRKTFNCYSCGKQIVKLSTYRDHYRRQHPDMIEIDTAKSFVPKVANAIVCLYCLKMFEDATTFDTHMDNDHVKKMYACSHCPKNFPVKDRRDIHLLMHNNTRNYKCPLCDKAFNCSKNLKAHLVRHSNVRPFSCNICNKTFKTKACAQDHKFVHSDEKSFECEVCDKAFKHPKALHNHIRLKKHKQSK